MFSLKKIRDWGWPWSKNEAPLRPIREDRPPCPFYAFAWMGDIFIDAKGNGCALEGCHTPCATGMQRKPVSLKDCARWTVDPRTLERLRALSIFPDECHPEGAKEWAGMPFGDYFDFIMRDRT